jgi:hypothetical protein
MKFNRVLKKGMHGTDIKTLQTKLVELELYDKTPGGNFDKETFLAIKKLQRNEGIKADGKVDLILWNKILSKKKTEKKEIPSIQISNGLKIYDNLKNSNNNRISVEKEKLKVIFTYGNHRPDLYSEVCENISYLIGGCDGTDNSFDGKVYRCLDDDKVPSEEIIIGICNWGELIGYKSDFITKCGTIFSGEIREKDGLYYHKVSDKQLESMNKLIDYLKDKYDISDTSF